MIEYPALFALQAVLRTGSFEAAAETLHITQSAVSQRIKSLEDRLGTSLVRRTRPATPTEAGTRLLRHAEEVGLLERRLADDLEALRPGRSAPVRIAVTADSLACFLLPAFASVKGFLFDLVIDDQEYSAELLRRGDAAAAVTTAGPPVPGCDAQAMGALPYVGFASPAFHAAHFAQGVTAETLATAPAITFNQKDGLQRRMAAEIAGQPVHLTTHYMPSTHAITDAAIAGLGWAVNPTPLITPHFTAGRLLPLADGYEITTPLMWQVPRQNRDALADLTRAITRAARQDLVQPSPA